MIATENLFEGVEKFVKDSRGLIASGSVVEIAGLEGQVQELCSSILQLSEEDRMKYADLLQNVFKELEELSKDLTVQREALINEIRYLSSHKKANIAYKTADGTEGNQEQ